jgi:catechol 2,3-dioxygenase-like lactoylglutathione lyase family enzyme
MAGSIPTGAVHHLRLTVSDPERAREFYTGVLNFEVAVELPNGYLLSNGSVLMGIGTAPEGATPGDRFDENRVGLDHLSFSAPSRAALDEAARVLDERGIPNGGVKDLGADFGLYILAFRDPDNIQLELTAAYS